MGFDFDSILNESQISSELGFRETLAYTDETRKKLNARVSRRIQDDLLINDNPHVYKGFIESKKGEFINKRVQEKSDVSESYIVSDPKIEQDFYIYTISGLDP